MIFQKDSKYFLLCKITKYITHQSYSLNTKFKIVIFLSCVVVFYFSLIPITFGCISLFDDCGTLTRLFTETRIAIYSGDNFVWHTGDGVGAWSGTAEHGIEDVEPEPLIRAENNIGFIVFVMFVGLICLLIYFVDKKRIKV